MDEKNYDRVAYSTESLIGAKRYYLDYYLHRTNGPAVIWENGDREWYLNGKLHRTDGPAIENGCNGTLQNMWYLNGIKLSEEDHKKAIADPTILKEILAKKGILLITLI